MAAERPPAGLLRAARTNSRLKALKALRDRLADEIDDCDSKRDMASLSLRFMDVVEQIAALEEGESKPEPTKETGLSEFEKRLRARMSEAQAPRRAEG